MLFLDINDLILPRNNVPSNEEVRGKPWYYGPISRGDCDNLMAERGQDGDFLVRDSESNVSHWITFSKEILFKTLWDTTDRICFISSSTLLTNLNVSL